MKHYELDPKALLGGVIASDGNQEIVQLSLQKNNEIPAYETDAIILLLVLNGKAEIKTVDEVLQTEGLQVIRLEPMEAHSIRALSDNTNILVIKQLIHETGLSKRLRFGSISNLFSPSLHNRHGWLRWCNRLFSVRSARLLLGGHCGSRG